jgi:acetylornithine deacetylase/succinyl-diaminopimelate desuccinylase-like protein
MINQVLELAIEIQQIPAPTFEEQKRAEFIRDRFIQGNLKDVQIDEIGNVFGRLPGSDPVLPIIVSAHLDTVFPTGTDLSSKRLEEKITGPGIGDNAIGLAGLFGLLWDLDRQQINLKSDLWLVANVGEEGLGDLRGMREVVNWFEDRIKAYVILEGMSLGQVYHRGLGVRRYRVTVNTSGGHSWVDYGKPSAIHELTHIATRLLAIRIPKEPRTSMNVGVISGGISVNTIASEAHLDLDLRSEDIIALKDLVRSVNSILESSQRPGVRVSEELVGHRPVGEISQTHPIIELVVGSLEKVGIQPRMNIGSTDANIPLSLGYPAICLGLTTGNGAHTVHEYINTPPLQLGLKQLRLVVEGLDRG